MRLGARSSSHPVRWVLPIVVAALAACSGDDDPPPTAPPPVETTAPPTTTTTIPPTTTIAPSTTSVPTTLPTTEPPAPTTDDVQPIPQAEAIAAAVIAFGEAFNQAASDPGNTEFRAEIDRLSAEPLTARVLDSLDEYVELNRVQHLNPDVPAGVEAALLSAVLAEPPFAAIDACVVDSGILVEVGGNPDGTDRVINDQIIARAVTFTLANEGGRWVVSEFSPDREFEGQTTCSG